MQNQVFALILFILCGALIGITFDFFRIIRRIFKMPNIATYIEDIIFWMFTGGILIFLIYGINGRRNKVIFNYRINMGCIFIFFFN